MQPSFLLPAQLEKGRILSKNLGLGSKSFKRVENEVRLTLIKVSGVVPSFSKEICKFHEVGVLGLRPPSTK
jgi:hypothetical protein